MKPRWARLSYNLMHSIRILEVNWISVKVYERRASIFLFERVTACWTVSRINIGQLICLQSKLFNIFEQQFNGKQWVKPVAWIDSFHSRSEFNMCQNSWASLPLSCSQRPLLVVPQNENKNHRTANLLNIFFTESVSVWKIQTPSQSSQFKIRP